MFICLIALSFVGYAQTGTVILEVSGIKVAKGGELSAGIFRKENFAKVGKQFIGTVKKVEAAKMQIVFKNVPVGNYGMVVFQDIDQNKDLKTNFVGFPTEPIGFSNDARIRFGPPSFEDAKVQVEKDKTLTLPIILR